MGKAKVPRYQVNGSTQEQRVANMMKVLELDGALLSLENELENATKNHTTHLAFLESLLEKNFTFNEQRRINRWVQQAKFPRVKTLQEFDFARNPDIDQQQILELASSRFIKKGQNIILMGPTGVGKTHLATAIGVEAIDHGYDVKFTKLEELVSAVERTPIEGMQRLVRSFVRPKLLIMDDIDFMDVSTRPNINEFIFTVVDKRYESDLSTIYITNKSFDQWDGLFGGDKVRTNAALDRILGPATVIMIDGLSQRVEQNRMRTLASADV
jgi:DNA replication protein DnaC